MSEENKNIGTVPETVEAPEAPTPKKEKLVRIRLPKTKDNQGDVFVSVNNRTWLIKRGVEVEVPACVAEVLRHQEEMFEESMLFESSAQSDNKNK